MFISYQFGNYLGKKDDKHIYEFELTDSEFGTVFGVHELYWNCRWSW
jgi:hypothetical protein